MTRHHCARFIRRIWLSAILGAALLAGATLSGMTGCAGTTPPPPARAELRPSKPHPRAVWVPGSWVWNGRKAGYRWVEGHWRKP